MKIRIEDKMMCAGNIIKIIFIVLAAFSALFGLILIIGASDLDKICFLGHLLESEKQFIETGFVLIVGSVGFLLCGFIFSLLFKGFGHIISNQQKLIKQTQIIINQTEDIKTKK